MFPFSRFRWDKISAKIGDSLTIELSPIQVSMLLVVLMNVKFVADSAPDSMSIGNDSDNFDAVISDILSKLAGV